MESSDLKDISCEPMDVDLSLSMNSPNNSVSQTEQPSTEHPSPDKPTNVPEVSNIKKFHIVRDKSKAKNSNKALFVLGSIVLVLSIVMYSIFGFKCSDNINLNELRVKLENKLHGQPEVINEIIESLQKDVNNKVLFLYGGTGVGKTFTVSLALENMWNYTNIYHYTMPSFLDTYSTNSMLGLNVCESTIVVVDDLKQTDFDVRKQISELITKSENLSKNITIILIFNCDVTETAYVNKCDDTFYTELTQAFRDVVAYKTFIRFKPLTQEVLQMCIKDELKGRHVTDMNFDDILSNFNVTLDGCKGVHKKIKFINVL